MKAIQFVIISAIHGLSLSKSISQSSENSSSEIFNLFEPLPQVLVTSPCSWHLQLNEDTNRIPGNLIYKKQERHSSVVRRLLKMWKIGDDLRWPFSRVSWQLKNVSRLSSHESRCLVLFVATLPLYGQTDRQTQHTAF